MKGEYKRMDQAMREMIQNTPPEKVKDFYYNKSLESKRALWLYNDIEGFERKEKEIGKLIDKMNYDQKESCQEVQYKVLNDVLYDLKKLLRSEALEYINLYLAYAHLFMFMKEDLEAYEATGDNDYIKSIHGLIDSLISDFNIKYWNDESMEQLKENISILDGAPELNASDKDNIMNLKRHYEIYSTIKEHQKNGDLNG